MNTFIQHIPSCVDIDEPPKKITFESVEDLLNIEVVKQFKQNPNFYSFELAGNALMAIFAKGFSWWCVGYVENPTSVNLPQWSGGKYQVKLANGEVVVLERKDVISTCGDQILLRTGAFATNLRYTL